MSLQMISSFMGPNGTVPTSVFTVVKKDNDDVELVTITEDKAVAASVEHINDLIRLHDRVAREGLSRATVQELQRIAPSAVPGGYGLEAFTEIPSNVMLKEGLEGMVATALTALYKLIKFLIEKLKAGFDILVNSYRVLTGISPSAYKLAKMEVYNEEMIKNWRKIMESDLDEEVLKALQANPNLDTGAQLILNGFWNDADDICNNLAAFEPIVAQLQRAVEDMLIESSMQQNAYNRMWDVVNKGNVTDETYRDSSMRLARMIGSPDFQKVSKLMEQLAKKVLESKLYKADDKIGKSIVDRLRSDKFRDILNGLSEACRVSKPTCLKPSDVMAKSGQQNFDAIVNQLKNFDPVDQKKVKDFKQHLDGLRVYERYVTDGMTEEKGFETLSTEFLSQQNDVKAVVDVVREITANYAETVFKLTAFRNRVRLVVVPKMTANTPDEQAMEAHEAKMDQLRASIRAWVGKATKL